MKLPPKYWKGSKSKLAIKKNNQNITNRLNSKQRSVKKILRKDNMAVKPEKMVWKGCEQSVLCNEQNGYRQYSKRL